MSSRSLLLEEAFAAEAVEYEPAKVEEVLAYGVDGRVGNIMEDLCYEACKRIQNAIRRARGQFAYLSTRRELGG